MSLKVYQVVHCLPEAKEIKAQGNMGPGWLMGAELYLVRSTAGWLEITRLYCELHKLKERALKL